MRAQPYPPQWRRQGQLRRSDVSAPGRRRGTRRCRGANGVRSPGVTSPIEIASLAARERAKGLLAERLGLSRLLTEPTDCAAYCHDESEAEGTIPDAVVLAQSESDIEVTLRVARETGVPVTPRAAGRAKPVAAFL